MLAEPEAGLLKELNSPAPKMLLLKVEPEATLPGKPHGKLVEDVLEGTGPKGGTGVLLWVAGRRSPALMEEPKPPKVV